MSTDFERHIAESPEPKLELIGGRLTIGNSLLGSRWTLHDLLEGYGAGAALPFAEKTLWLEAISRVYCHLTPPAIHAPLNVWRAWGAQVDHTLDVKPAGPRTTGPHYEAASRLRMDIFAVSRESGLGAALGGDVVMRLGNDGLTPDVLMVRSERSQNWFEWFLDGPADLIIEVTLDGHEGQDRDTKLGLYERGKVPEYWIIDPTAKAVDLLRLSPAGYERQHLDADGGYRPASVPGLVFWPKNLWHGDEWGRGPRLFTAEREGPDSRWESPPSETEWGALPFAPAPGLEPGRLSFDEYVSWTPRAKFEISGGKPLIGGCIGTRNVFGMLLRTFGLASAARLLHPREWIDALLQAQSDQKTAPEKRKQYWSGIRAAADLLRQNKYGRLTVIGDLVGSAPLNVWSDVTLVTYDGPNSPDWNLLTPLSELLDNLNWDIRRHDRLTRAQLRELDERGVEI